ncbi:MAG: type II secretion system protein [Methylococcaceae bacterium]|nr:type II secretion system protein [Methylococcaceae bacterium]
MHNKLNIHQVKHAPRSLKAENGFSLLEILVAFAILALSIGVLLNIFSRGLRTAIVSEEYQQALAVAESQMARAGVDVALSEGSINGQVDGKYNWSIQGSPYVAPQPKSDIVAPQPLEIRAFNVQVRVEWSDGADNKEVVLNSVRLAKVPL